MNFGLPTTCMSPDTSIVLKCGASAETMRMKGERIHENISRSCDFSSTQILLNGTLRVECDQLRPSASIQFIDFCLCRGAIEYGIMINITLPSHENFPEMFVSTCDITTCVALDKVVCGERKKKHCTILRYLLHVIAFYLNVDASDWERFYTLRLFRRVAIELSSAFVPLYRVQ
jgi:hypothetical protein